MSRPSRVELMRRFFPELGETGSRAETEAAIQLNTRACEAILADQIELFDRFFSERGAGVLCLKLAEGDRESFYLALADFEADLATARRTQDENSATLLQRVIAAIEANDFERDVLVLLMDNSRFTLLPVSREYPARAIQAMQEEFTV